MFFVFPFIAVFVATWTLNAILFSIRIDISISIPGCPGTLAREVSISIPYRYFFAVYRDIGIDIDIGFIDSGFIDSGFIDTGVDIDEYGYSSTSLVLE